MARGMVVGEQINSQAQSKAFDEGYERAGLGKSETSKQRGRFIWDERQQKLVRAEDYIPPEEARNAPIMCDRYMEGVSYDMGDRQVDIGSRKKRREFMRATGWADYDDFRGEWAKAKKDRERYFQKGGDRKRTEIIGRAIYEHSKRKSRAR